MKVNLKNRNIYISMKDSHINYVQYIFLPTSRQHLEFKRSELGSVTKCGGIINFIPSV
jgi:hypothetical protein